MGIKQSLSTIIDAYNEGIIPAGLYSPGIGNGPSMSYPTYDESLDKYEFTRGQATIVYTSRLLKHFTEITSIFNADGSLNPNSHIAETYAISLALEKKYANSIKMFDLITAKGFDIPIKRDKTVLPVVNNFGKLGFEGVIQYADACKALDMTDKAEALYRRIADLPRACHGSIRYGDVRVEALAELVHTFRMNGYTALLKLAQDKQW